MSKKNLEDKIRLQSLSPGEGVSFREWAAFANEMKQRYKPFGIVATTDARSVSLGDKLLKQHEVVTIGHADVTLTHTSTRPATAHICNMTC